MKKVKVIDIKDNFLYTLQATDNTTYKKNIEFIDININIGDIIYISNDVLKNKNIYTYGPIIEKNNPEDLIKIIHNNKDIYLQRYYG